MNRVILSLILCLVSHAEELRGKVVSVHDGDTMTLLEGKTQHKVRLDAIDAPESNQAFGEVSRKALEKMIAGKEAVVTWQKKDRNGRIIGRVTVDTVQVNLKQVQDGMAWHYVDYNDEEKFALAQSAAKKQGLGLWRDASPVAPWEFRKQAKKRKG